MADNNLRFSTAVAISGDDEFRWWKDMVSRLEWGEDEPICVFEVHEDKVLCFTNELNVEYGKPHELGLLVQKFFRVFPTEKRYLDFAYSWDCSSGYINGFGGGAVFVTVDEVCVFNSDDWREQSVKRFEAAPPSGEGTVESAYVQPPDTSLVVVRRANTKQRIHVYLEGTDACVGMLRGDKLEWHGDSALWTPKKTGEPKLFTCKFFTAH